MVSIASGKLSILGGNYSLATLARVVITCAWTGLIVKITQTPSTNF